MSGFDARALDRSYAYLDDLPESLYVPVVTHRHGAIRDRAEGILRWRQALLAGALPAPEDLPWPPARLRDALLHELHALGVARFCRGQEELTDALLLSILDACEGFARGIEDRLPVRLAILRAEELARRTEKAQQGERTKKAAEVPPLTEAALILLRETALQQVHAEQLVEAAAVLRARWQEPANLWTALAEVFGELGQLLGRGWDLCQGLLAHHGWLEIARLRALLEHVPPLKALVQTLGRMQAAESPEQEPVLERILGPVRRAAEERREVRSPWARSETRGVVRSDDLARMLPSEATLLGHPRLRTLWHARRAERTLLCYQVEGVLTEHIATEVEGQIEIERPAPRRERGPILLCLDTSGSMAGHPEQVAKALALEVVRVAHAERRACYLYAFSGPGDVIEHELSLTARGLSNFMGFLVQSFHGGTDVQGPLLRALERLQQAPYQRADLVLLTDGEFPVPSDAVEAIRQARANTGLRVHGVLISTSDSPAMAVLCDPLHRFADWGALERGTGR